MQFDHYFPVWHYIRVDSSVASLKSRFLIIISIARDMRLGVHNFELRGTFFYVRREVDVIKTAKANAYIIHIFGKIELLSIHAT